MTSERAVVVVGAGLAGLTAAALLQKRGARVTLLEAHALPGGCAGWFRRSGFQYAVGATIATGFEPGGLHHRVYRELGLEPDVAELDACYDVVLDDRRVRVWNDRARWRQELHRHFGAQAPALDKFWNRVTRVAAATRGASAGLPAMPVETWRDAVDLALSGLRRPGSMKALPTFGETVDEALEAAGLTDEAHRTMCRAQILDAMQSETSECPFPNGALALDVYRYGCQYVRGGMGRVARDLLKTLLGDGGVARFRTRATECVVEGDRVVGVRDDKGEVHRGEVVCALPGDATRALLPESLRPRLDERARRAALGWGAFTLYLAVDERVLPPDHPLFVMAVDGIGGSLHDGHSVFVSTSPADDPTRAPAGWRAVTMSTHTDAASWWALSPEAYEARKSQMTERLLDVAERAVPGLRSGIAHCLPGTPRTFEAYTSRPLGRVGGVPQTMQTANFRALGHRGEFPGLWHAGDGVFPGQGAVGVTLGAMLTARSVGRALGLG
jgi:C-3',4' desaturase CrtD